MSVEIIVHIWKCHYNQQFRNFHNIWYYRYNRQFCNYNNIGHYRFNQQYHNYHHIWYYSILFLLFESLIWMHPKKRKRKKSIPKAFVSLLFKCIPIKMLFTTELHLHTTKQTGCYWVLQLIIFKNAAAGRVWLTGTSSKHLSWSILKGRGWGGDTLSYWSSDPTVQAFAHAYRPTCVHPGSVC